MAAELTNANFDELTKDQITLIDFWAPWCGPCRRLTPVIEELAKDFAGQATIAKCNIDDEPELAQKFGIMTIPSIFILKNGEPVQRMGPAMKSDYETALKKAIAG